MRVQIMLVVSIVLVSAGCASSLGATPRPRAQRVVRAAPRAHRAPYEVHAEACFAAPIAYDAHFVWRPRAVMAVCLASGDAHCQFALASEAYTKGRFDVAGPLSLRIAFARGDPHEADAARIFLESANAVGTTAELRRDACLQLLQITVPALLDELCSPAPEARADAVCAVLHLVDVDATRCSECAIASLSGRDPFASLRAGAELALRYTRELGCSVAKDVDVDECIEFLSLASRTFRYLGDAVEATESLRMLGGLRDRAAVCKRIAEEHLDFANVAGCR